MATPAYPAVITILRATGRTRKDGRTCVTLWVNGHPMDSRSFSSGLDGKAWAEEGLAFIAQMLSFADFCGSCLAFTIPAGHKRCPICGDAPVIPPAASEPI